MSGGHIFVFHMLFLLYCSTYFKIDYKIWVPEQLYYLHLAMQVKNLKTLLLGQFRYVGIGQFRYIGCSNQITGAVSLIITPHTSHLHPQLTFLSFHNARIFSISNNSHHLCPFILSYICN
jgi:hypothetical protein